MTWKVLSRKCPMLTLKTYKPLCLLSPLRDDVLLKLNSFSTAGATIRLQVSIPPFSLGYLLNAMAGERGRMSNPKHDENSSVCITQSESTPRLCFGNGTHKRSVEDGLVQCRVDCANCCNLYLFIQLEHHLGLKSK